MRLILLPLLLLTTGCSTAQDWFDRARHASLPPLRGPSGDAPNAPKQLEGEYRVAGIDGQPLDAAFGIAVSISRDTISYEPHCAGFRWIYHYRGGWLATQRTDDTAGDESNTAQPDCAGEVAPELVQLASAFDSGQRADQTAENGTLVSGGGRSVLLFRQ